jgi:hypothetical protein
MERPAQAITAGKSHRTGNASRPKRRIEVNDFSTKAALSLPRKRLLEAMQRLNFGWIEDLEVRGGEPLFRQTAPRITQDIKIGAENGPRPECEKGDFLLRTAVIELFTHLNRIDNGRIAKLEVRHGLPFRLVVAHASMETVR